VLVDDKGIYQGEKEVTGNTDIDTKRTFKTMNSLTSSQFLHSKKESRESLWKERSDLQNGMLLFN